MYRCCICGKQVNDSNEQYVYSGGWFHADCIHRWNLGEDVLALSGVSAQQNAEATLGASEQCPGIMEQVRQLRDERDSYRRALWSIANQEVNHKLLADTVLNAWSSDD